MWKSEDVDGAGAGASEQLRDEPGEVTRLVDRPAGRS